MEDIDKKKILFRLMALTRITSDGHYLWLGKRNSNGHGKIKIGGRHGVEHSVNRVSAFIHLGLVLSDESQQALHKKSCSYKNCWNSNCLYIGTHKDNMKDERKDHCINNHPRSGWNLGMNRDGTTYCRTCVSNRQRKVRQDKEATNTKTS